MTRVLLVNPPFYRLLGSHYNANSLGIAYIAAILNQNGHDAWLYNADFQDRNLYPPVSELFASFGNYLSFFKNEDADIWSEVVNNIERFDPDWVGFTSYTANLSAIDIISRLLKKRLPKVRQVVGGVHATLDLQILDRVPAVDFAVRREGEFAMLDLVNGKDPRTISGVVGRKSDGTVFDNGDASVIADIDQLPFPERDKFWNLTEAQARTIDVSYICSVRGCPYRCNYCASPFHWKRNATQYRSAKSVIMEMKHLKVNYWRDAKRHDFSASANTRAKSELIIRDNTIVYFVDDIFTIKKPRAKSILRMMIAENLNMPWKCEVRADHLDEEICELMAEANCARVKIGFESGSDRILRMIQKDETVDDMRRAVRMLKQAGVPITAYFMAGFPGETDEDLKRTIEFARDIDADYYSLSVLAPYYGTKLYFSLLDQGYRLDKKDWEYFYHQSGELLVNSSISQKVLQEYLELNELNLDGERYV